MTEVEIVFYEVLEAYYITQKREIEKFGGKYQEKNMQFLEDTIKKYDQRFKDAFGRNGETR